MGLNGKDLIIDGWFHERGELWKGQAMSLQVKKVIEHFQSDFQDILVFESEHHGTVLVLDGTLHFHKAIAKVSSFEVKYSHILIHDVSCRIEKNPLLLLQKIQQRATP